MEKSLIILIIILLALVITYIIIDAVKKRKTAAGENTEAVEKAQSFVIELINKIGLAVFTEAENTYGGGTGILKMSWALSKILSVIPDSVKQLIDMDWVEDFAETGLAAAKEAWAQNSKLLKADVDSDRSD